MPQSMPRLQREKPEISPTATVVPEYGIAQGTQVLTLDGVLPVEALCPADRIVTRAGMRRLQAVEAVVVRKARLVRLAPDVLGGSRPETALLLPPDQPILLRGRLARWFVDKDQALIPAARLADDDHRRDVVVDETRIFTLKLDGPAAIYAGGLELACEGETAAA